MTRTVRLIGQFIPSLRPPSSLERRDGRGFLASPTVHSEATDSSTLTGRTRKGPVHPRSRPRCRITRGRLVRFRIEDSCLLTSCWPSTDMSCYLGIWRTDSSTCVVWVAQDLCSKLSDCAMILLSCSIIPSVASVARRWSVHAMSPSLSHLRLSKQKTAGPLLTTHTHIQARQKTCSRTLILHLTTTTAQGTVCSTTCPTMHLVPAADPLGSDGSLVTPRASLYTSSPVSPSSVLCSLFCPRSLFHHVLGFATTLPNHVARETPEVATHIPARGPRVTHLRIPSVFRPLLCRLWLLLCLSTRPLAKSLPASRPQSARGPEKSSNIDRYITSECLVCIFFNMLLTVPLRSRHHWLPPHTMLQVVVIVSSASLLRPLAALTRFQVLSLHCDGSIQSLYVLPLCSAKLLHPFQDLCHHALKSSLRTLHHPVPKCL